MNNDTLIDLGSGDGVVLQEALRAGAGRVVGYELNPMLAVLSRLRLIGSKAHSRVFMKNMWSARPAEANTVVYVFSVSRDTVRLARMMERWANDTRQAIDVIMYGHELPNCVAVSTHRGHRLYRFSPLQKN